MDSEDAAINFYKRHLGDIAKSCSDLSQGQMGAYDLLLDWHYANEKPLPLAADKLYRIARAVDDPERANVDSVLAELFTKTNEGYTHKRAAEEMAKASAQADTNRRIAEEREARKRETNEARSVHEAFNEACTNRQPSQTPDSRLHKEQEQRAGAIPTKSRGTRLPIDWSPSPDLLAWATTERPDIPLSVEIDKFRDHWKSAAGAKGVKLDWSATFRNWVRNANAGKTNANLQSSRKLSVVEQIETNIRDRREREGDCGDAALVLLGHG